MENTARHFRIFRSRAFRGGLADGFSSMFTLSFGRGRYGYRAYDTVDSSWREVGDLLKEATQVQGQAIEQTTEFKNTKSARH